MRRRCFVVLAVLASFVAMFAYTASSAGAATSVCPVATYYTSGAGQIASGGVGNAWSGTLWGSVVSHSFVADNYNAWPITTAFRQFPGSTGVGILRNNGPSQSVQGWFVVTVAC
jgi:hypothetical protein